MQMEQKQFNEMYFWKNVINQDWRQTLGIIFIVKNKKQKKVVENALMNFPAHQFYVCGEMMNLKYPNFTMCLEDQLQDIYKRCSILFCDDKQSDIAIEAGLSGLDVVSSEADLLKSIINWNNEDSFDRIDNFEKTRKLIDKMRSNC